MAAAILRVAREARRALNVDRPDDESADDLFRRTSLIFRPSRSTARSGTFYVDVFRDFFTF